MSDHRFQNLLDLARLPYFENQDGRLVLRDRSIGPVIDCHSHVALAYLLPMQVDLYKLHPETEHYLPSCCAIDLDVYNNKNWPDGHVHEVSRDLVLRGMTGRGMRRTHTVANLLREMDEMHIVRSVLLPIDFPVISNNAKHAFEAAKRDERIIGFGSVHPYHLNLADRLDAQAHQGAKGIKMHPNVQQVSPDHPRAMELYRLCGERNMPVLWHCGPVGLGMEKADARCQVHLYERPIAENPDTTFILGHAGALQAEAALQLQIKYPNVYLELNGPAISVLKRVFSLGDPDRLLFGSDWPFYHQAIVLAKVLLLTEGDPELRAKILHKNALRVLNCEL